MMYNSSILLSPNSPPSTLGDDPPTHYAAPPVMRLLTLCNSSTSTTFHSSSLAVAPTLSSPMVIFPSSRSLLPATKSTWTKKPVNLRPTPVPCGTQSFPSPSTRAWAASNAFLAYPAVPVPPPCRMLGHTVWKSPMSSPKWSFTAVTPVPGNGCAPPTWNFPTATPT